MDGDEADAEEEEEDLRQLTYDTLQEQQELDTERRVDHTSDNDGDIEDADGLETERRTRPNILNKISGGLELSHLEQDYFKKKTKVNKQFPLNHMRRRQSGSLGQSKKQMQRQVSGER